MVVNIARERDAGKGPTELVCYSCRLIRKSRAFSYNIIMSADDSESDWLYVSA